MSLKYVVVKEVGSRKVIFVKFTNQCAVVSEEYKDATIFTNEASAKDVACQLNHPRYGSEGGWYAKKFYI